MEKVIIVDGKEVKMKASALVPRIYRFRFGRDIIQDLNQLRRSFEKAQKAAESLEEEERKNAQLSVMDLTIFENVAFVMARHADPSLPDTVDEWLEGFEMFSIYEVLPEILDLWQMGCQTTSVPKKK